MPKNNLGIICKHGYNEKIKKNSANGIVYFEEAIRQKNDLLSMYNLAHTYIYDETIKQDIHETIDLLIKSSEKTYFSEILLSFFLVKHFGFNYEMIRRKIEERPYQNFFISKYICQMIKIHESQNKSFFESEYELYREYDLVYDLRCQPVSYPKIMQIKYTEIPPKYPFAKDITSLFYEGLGNI